MTQLQQLKQEKREAKAQMIIAKPLIGYRFACIRSGGLEHQNFQYSTTL